MTTRQAMLGLVLLIGGCDLLPQRPTGPDALSGPYATPRVWAVAPLRNESGSLYADGLVMADHFAAHLTNAANIEMMPVNRVLRAMEALQMAEVASPEDARQLLETLGADALLIGTITAYDPYDPPKLGLTIELYDGGRRLAFEGIDSRQLTRAATGDQVHPGPLPGEQPLPRREGVASGVSAYFNAADHRVRDLLIRYAGSRGGDPLAKHEDNWHRYRLSMDLYSEFVTYVMSWRLLDAEWLRVTPPPVTDDKANEPQASR